MSGGRPAVFEKPRLFGSPVAGLGLDKPLPYNKTRRGGVDPRPRWRREVSGRFSGQAGPGAVERSIWRLDGGEQRGVLDGAIAFNEVTTKLEAKSRGFASGSAVKRDSGCPYVYR